MWSEFGEYMGFEVDNTPFARHSWYFRNALVCANYSDKQRGIHKDYTSLVRFLSNLLMGESHELKNRYLIIPDTAVPASTEQVTEQVTEQARRNL